MCSSFFLSCMQFEETIANAQANDTGRTPSILLFLKVLFLSAHTAHFRLLPQGMMSMQWCWLWRATGKWMMDDLVRVEVGWVCFDVLFFISEFHFLFLLIFILFSRACLYICNWCFPLRCLFQCLFVCLFVLLFYFVFIPFLYLFIVSVM